MTEFRGAAYDEDVDHDRLHTQMGQVLQILESTTLWLTVAQIRYQMRDAFDVEAPEPSVSAQIRNLRKPANGQRDIQGRYRKETRIFEYRLIRDGELGL